jgi:hypothetical protein
MQLVNPFEACWATLHVTFHRRKIKLLESALALLVKWNTKWRDVFCLLVREELIPDELD